MDAESEKQGKVPLLRLNHGAEFTWGAEQMEDFNNINDTLSSSPYCKRQVGFAVQVVH
jgi:hypothetical protein